MALIASAADNAPEAAMIHTGGGPVIRRVAR